MEMSNEQVIVDQAKKLAILEKKNDLMQAGMKTAIMRMICIGGPLNDNKLGYSHEQQLVFQSMLNDLESSLPKER
jgi:putative AlgH/UPF0301 family transcriptional regulator